MKRDVSVILLYTTEGKILLQHRADDARRLPGYWAFFGGGIDEGETPLQAVVRETREELEYDLVDPECVMMQDLETGKKYVYCAPFDSAQSITQHEGQGYGWYTVDETLGLKVIEHDRVVFEYIKQFFASKKI